MYVGWLIYRKEDAERNQAYIDWFIEECSKQSIKLHLVLREEIGIGIQNNQLSLESKYPLPDFAVVRTIEQMLSSHLERLGVAVFNSSTVSMIANHKGMTHQVMGQLGIPMVDTTFYRKHDQVVKPPLPFPIVVKDTEGRGGKQVFLANDMKEWDEIKPHQWDSDWLVQSTNVQPGKDLRVFVIGKKVIAAVLRENHSDFRANFSLGGKARLYELSVEEIKIVQTIIDAFDFDMVGIDFLFSLEGKLLFNEIEDIVGSRTLSQLSSINLLAQYVNHIRKTLEETN
ncbi:hypothetical protein KO561_12025 [Radiobacillus kanasensis]|nr:hypothetical protein [Radiobacillus kanasensis]UFU01394.1 hypothetical protein KO561_12025 [Radiobacillus kanasensis]